MTAEPKHYRVNDETRAKPLIRAAMDSPVVVEIDSKSYEVNVKDAATVPFTARSAYGSLPSLPGRENISDEELERIIRQANEQHAREIIDQMQKRITDEGT